MENDPRAQKLVEEYVRDRQWLTCKNCGITADAQSEEDLRMAVIASEEEGVIAVLCLDCLDNPVEGEDEEENEEIT